MKTQLAVIPFSGFYESFHDQMLDDALEQMFWDDDDGNVNQGLLWTAHDAVNWRKVHEAYAKEYAENFGQAFDLPSLEFDELNSPLEYNFTTDRIFVRISPEDVKKLWERVDLKLLVNVCRDEFTSRSGFSSFYDPDFESWGDLEDWDHNQLGALIEAVAAQDGMWDENHAMEYARDNSMFDNWIEESMPEPLRTRIFKVRDYLREREQRA